MISSALRERYIQELTPRLPTVNTGETIPMQAWRAVEAFGEGWLESAGATWQSKADPYGTVQIPVDAIASRLYGQAVGQDPAPGQGYSEVSELMRALYHGGFAQNIVDKEQDTPRAIMNDLLSAELGSEDRGIRWQQFETLIGFSRLLYLFERFGHPAGVITPELSSMMKTLGDRRLINRHGFVNIVALRQMQRIGDVVRSKERVSVLRLGQKATRLVA